MNKLLIQQYNCKFINNIQLSTTNFCEKIIIDTKNFLYKIYYQYQFTSIILIDSLLSQEEYQFINEFGDIVKILIYVDTDANNYEHCNKNKIYGLLSHTKFDSKYKVFKIPTLVNNEIYMSNRSIKKTDQIVSFIEDINVIPEKLNEYLYPKSQLPIKLFNNENIIHPQNLGLVSESDKSLLLQESNYYLAITELYVPEAWACDCIVLSLDDLETLQATTYKHSQNFQSYSNFLKGLLSVKK